MGDDLHAAILWLLSLLTDKRDPGPDGKTDNISQPDCDVAGGQKDDGLTERSRQRKRKGSTMKVRTVERDDNMRAMATTSMR